MNTNSFEAEKENNMNCYFDLPIFLISLNGLVEANVWYIKYFLHIHTNNLKYIKQYFFIYSTNNF